MKKKIEEKEKENNFNWDNDFSVRFKLNNENQLKYVPNNIFMIELPEMDMLNMGNESEMDEKYVDITFRTTKDKTVEQEVYSYLMNTPFNIEISLHNPNITDFELIDCFVSKIIYSPLIHRNKSNYFNFKVRVKLSTMKVHQGDSTFLFGEERVDYMSLVNKDKK